MNATHRRPSLRLQIPDFHRDTLPEMLKSLDLGASEVDPAAMGNTLVRTAKRAVYLARGKKPMSTGYGVYKEDRITEILAAGAFDPEHLGPGYGVGLDERVVEYPWLFSRLPPGPGRLFDAGSVLNFDHLLTHPALRAKQIFISTLAPEAPRQQMRPNVSYVYEDLRETCYRNRYFDWVVCISTLEHVGLDNTRFYTSDLTGKEATGRSPAFSQRPASSATSDTRGTASGSHRDRPREKRPTSTTTPLAATTRTTPLRRAPWCA